MLNRAHCLSSSPDLFAEECDSYWSSSIPQQLDSSSREINSNFAMFKQMRPFELFCRSRIKDQSTLYEDNCPILKRK